MRTKRFVLTFRVSRQPVFVVGAAVMLSLFLGQGCQSGSASLAGTQEISATAGPDGHDGHDGHEGRDRNHGAVPLPPGLNRASITPRRGEALERARMSLDAVVESLPTPVFLKQEGQAAAGPAGGDEDGEVGVVAGVVDQPPVAGQAAYVAGRQAWRDGKTFEAIRQLTAASRYMPHSAHVHRLLGVIHTQSGNRIKGAYHLEKAVARDATDVMSLFLLGRHLWQQGQWRDAVMTFDLARGQVNRKLDSHEVLGPLVSYHLAMALVEGGFDEAAATQLENFLELSGPEQVRTGLDLMLAAIHRQDSLVLQMIGDARLRLGQTERALASYERAMGNKARAEGDGEDFDGLSARLVFALLELDRRAQAQAVVLDHLERSGASEHALVLTQYFMDVTGEREAIREALDGLYRQQGQPASLALAIARMLPGAQGLAVLEAHLEHQPTDRVVLRRLIELQLGAAPPRIAELLDTLTGIIAAHPETAASHLDLLAAAAPSLVAIETELSEALRKSRFDGARAVAGAYLHAGVLQRLGRGDDAIAVLNDALGQGLEGRADPEGLYRPAAVLLAQWLIEREAFEAAQAVLDRIGDPADTDVVSMRVRVLMGMGKHGQAAALLDEWLELHPRDVSLLGEQARLQIEAQRYHEAENTLLRAIDRNPREASLYTLLYELYDEGRVADADRQKLKLLERMQREIPVARITRLRLAQHHIETGQADKALVLFEALVADDPNDWEALGHTLVLLAISGRQDEAQAIVERRLAGAPHDRRLLETIRSYYGATRNTPQWLDISLKLLSLDPPSERRSLEMISIYRHLERHDETARLLEEAFSGEVGELKDAQTFAYHLMHLETDRHEPPEAFKVLGQWVARYPKYGASLMLVQAMVAEKMGDRARSEGLMVELLEKHPQHAPTNNALGYSWANRGEQLERALMMIKVAVEAEPDNAAYLDSMGWVLYKLGRFEEAVKWLQDSREASPGPQAVIYDHLADALYRVGRVDEAQLWWRRARIAVSGEDPANDPEIEGLDKRLDAKLAAVGAKREPAVAVSPVADDEQDEQDERDERDEQPGEQSGEQVEEAEVERDVEESPRSGPPPAP